MWRLIRDWTINFACLPRAWETGKARALEIDLRRVEANLSTDEEGKSIIKIHAEGDATQK